MTETECECRYELSEAMADFSKTMITVPCEREQCRGYPTLKPLDELLASDTVACRICGATTDLRTPLWRETLRKALESAGKAG
jgi:hypothetical protein